MSTFEASLIEYGEKLKVEHMKETARRMLEDGMNPAKVALYTGLSTEEIKKLKETHT